jgi:glycosyltransferase involved in cell wall biosynthesis
MSSTSSSSPHLRQPKRFDPLVSIVMATFNSTRFLPYSLRSIAGQSYSNIELILVDDGSTDDVEAELDKFSDWINIRYVRLATNRGLSFALNEALARASGELVARHDADDFMYPQRIEDQVLFLLENPDIDLVGAGVDNFGAQTGPGKSPITHTDILNQFLVSNPFFHPTIMFRRRLFDDGAYIYDPALRTEEDYHLWGRIIPHYRCANLWWSLIKYRLHTANNGRHPARKEIKRETIERFLNHFGVDGATDLATDLSEFQCSNFLKWQAFERLKAYATVAEVQDFPKLGWIHQRLLKARTYSNFYKDALW